VSESKQGFDGWAILELLGHVRIAGRSEPIAVSGSAPPGGPVHLTFPPEKLMGLPSDD